METTINTLTERDREKILEIQRSISTGTACTYDKNRNLEYLESILNPRCSVCRRPLKGVILIVRGHKIHKECREEYSQ